MFRARNACARFSTHFKTRPFCSTIKDSNNNKNNKKDNVVGKIESNVSTFNESYRQLEYLDFMTAAKILFTHPPNKKKFGIDLHLVQLFFACMLSLEARGEKEARRKAKRKQEEEEKAKDVEQIATDPELLEVKVRLGKLEEAVKQIFVESEKQSAGSTTKSRQNASEPGEDKSKSESSSSMEQDKVTKQKSTEQIPSADPGKVRSLSPVSDASQKDQKGENRIGGPSQDSKRRRKSLSGIRK